MKEVINFIEVPENLFPIIGHPDPNTRLYRQFGDETINTLWWDALLTLQPDISFVSPGGAASFVGVSRTAVHKRIKEGRLTAFVFYLIEKNEFLKRFNIERKQLASSGWPQEIFIPWCELKDWREYIQTRKGKEDQLKEIVKEGHPYNKFLKGNKIWSKFKDK